MRSLKRQRGFWDALVGGALGLFGSLLGNKSSAAQAQNTNLFNAMEAQKTRDWQSGENVIDRSFNAAEAQAAWRRNEQSASLQRDWSSAEAVRSRAWEKDMSDTAWRRGVADMRAAGLNPMLAYSQGGASTPNAGIPSGSVGTGPGASHSSAAGATARGVMARVFRPEIAASAAAIAGAERAKAAGVLDMARADVEREKVGLTSAQAAQVKQDTVLKTQQVAEVLSRIQVQISQENLNYRQMDKINAEINNYVLYGEKLSQETRNLLLKWQIDYYHLPDLKNKADVDKSWYMVNVGKWIKYAGGEAMSFVRDAAVAGAAGRIGLGSRVNIPATGLKLPKGIRVRPDGRFE